MGWPRQNIRKSPFGSTTKTYVSNESIHDYNCHWTCTCAVVNGHSAQCVGRCNCRVFKISPRVRNFEDELHETGGDPGIPSRTTTPERPSRDQVCMDAAFLYAQRGTCSRAQVGAVIAKDGRIIVTGYNGAPSGLPHCDHGTNEVPTVFGVTVPDSEWSRELQPQRVMMLPDSGTVITPSSGCQIAEHAERNAIAYAARYGLSTDQSTLYSTHAPCADCARTIINSGILRVFYTIPYRLTAGIELLELAGVEVIKMERETNE